MDFSRPLNFRRPVDFSRQRDYLGVMACQSEEGGPPPRRTEGYRICDCSPGVMIRVDVYAHRAESFLAAACDLLGDAVQFILERFEPQAGKSLMLQSPLLPSTLVLQHLRPHLLSLLHDGTLGFGLSASPLLEIFVTRHKTMQIFCSDRRRMLELISRFDIPHTPNKQFADESDQYALLNLSELEGLYSGVVRWIGPELGSTPPLSAVIDQLRTDLELQEVPEELEELEPEYFSDLEELVEDLRGDSSTAVSGEDEDLQ